MRRFLAVALTVVAILGAGWLAVRVPELPYETLEQVYASEESEFVTLENGTRIHFRDEGNPDGEALVLVHGFAASLHTWSEWIELLARDYRLVSLDLPGHGLSRGFPLEEVGTLGFIGSIDTVADAVGLDDFTIVGSSMGGAAAWAYALEHPGRVEGLVLVGAAGWPPTPEEMEEAPVVFKMMRHGAVRSILKDIDVSSMIRSGLEDSFVDTSLVTDAMVERYASLARGRGHRAALLHLLSGEADRLDATSDLMAEIDVPTLVLHGREDKLIPVRNGTRFAEAIAGAELVIFENVGHLPQEEIARESAAALAAFLESTVHATDVSTVSATQPGLSPEQISDRR